MADYKRKGERNMRKIFVSVLAVTVMMMAGQVYAAHNISENTDISDYGPEAIPQLMEAAALMGSDDIPVKIKAILRLGELKATESVPVLIDALGYGSETMIREAGGRQVYAYKVRLVSAKALAQIGDERAVKPLIRIAILDQDNTIRRAAVQALGLMGEKARTKEVLTYLYDILEKTKDNALAADICETLGKIGDKSSFVHLLRVTQGPYLNFVKEVAQKSIAETKWDKPSVFEQKTGGKDDSVSQYNK